MDSLNALAQKAEPEAEGNDYLQQLLISVALGLGAFLTFCFLRPRWTALYAARKHQKEAAAQLPHLPDSFFGWIPVLWRITDEEVLGSAGLDAFVFLSFFKMAIKFLAITLFFSLVVITPIHSHYTNNIGLPPYNVTQTFLRDEFAFMHGDLKFTKRSEEIKPVMGIDLVRNDYMWMYVAFVYFFSGIAIYLLLDQTKTILRIRQDYLGSQSTITDRTIRLSGIPPDLRSEEKLKEFIEALEIGKVDSVTICRNWEELDGLITERMSSLRQLEEALTVHLGKRRVERNLESLPAVQPPPPEPAVENDEDSELGLLLGRSGDGGRNTVPYARTRPIIKLRSGWFSLQSKKVDAIHYFEEKLRNLDEKIKSAREKEYKPMSLAFVTMDSVASCQMAIQAILDPLPLQLTANLAPAPTDVVWQNTYLSRNSRIARAWAITSIIVLLTIFWSLLEIPLAGLLSLESIRKVWPGLASALEGNSITKSLVQSSLPTLVWSLLNVAVPYLYDWLSNQQGMISQADVELSVISKNFFFTFFNLFLVFTVFGTASKFLKFVDDDIQDLAAPGRSKRIDYLIQKALELAQSLESLAKFYVDLIILQGIGLFPFRLLEFGSVAMYPLMLVGSKTPRDYAELVQPAIFMYGLYLPQTILIFIICIVYSVLKASWLVLLFGLIYFAIGHFTYKYQLLYAMDHTQHSTGKAWPMIGNRVIVGLIVFQLAMTGFLALQGAFIRSLLILILLIGTLWFSYFFRHTYEPFTRFIALGSIRRDGHSPVDVSGESEDGMSQRELRYRLETRNGRTVDEARETGLRYINPSLVMPLEDAWIALKRAEDEGDGIIDRSAQDGDSNV